MVIHRVWQAIKNDAAFFAVFFSAFLLFRTAAFAMYHIPSESMLPTLAVGDVVAVNKFAYGYSKHSVPFSLGPTVNTESGRVLYTQPRRGDIAVFHVDGKREPFIKRIIGLPGDTVALRDGDIILNGVKLERESQTTYSYLEHVGTIARVAAQTERLPSGNGETIEHSILDRGQYAVDNFGPIEISEGQLFVMGDNRDNSLDSRYARPIGVGMISTEWLIGRADAVLVSGSAFRRAPGYVHRTRWFSGL